MRRRSEVPVRRPDDVVADRSAAPGHTLQFCFGADIAKPRPPRRYLLRHFQLRHGRVNIVTAKGGVGKTLIVQAIGLAVAGGLQEVMGLKVDLHGRVRHVDWELGDDDVQPRYVRLAQPLGIDLTALGDMLGVVSFPDLKLTSPTAETEFAAVCDGTTLLIVDSLSAGTPGQPENDTLMRMYLDMLSRVSDRTKCTIIVVHHDGHAGHMRGSTAIQNAAGSVVGVDVAKDGHLVLKHEKASSGARAKPLHVSIVDVGERDFVTGEYPGLAIEPVEPPTDKVMEALKDDSGTRSAGKAARSVIELLREHGPLCQNDIVERVGGRKADVIAALQRMQDDGALKVTPGSRGAKVYEVVELEDVDRG